MSAVIRIPEKSGKDILLTFKYLKAESVAKLEAGPELVLEVSGEKVDSATAIIKYIAAKTKPELLGADKLEQAQIDEWLSLCNVSLRGGSKKEVVSIVDKKLNDHLNSKTYLVGNHLTVADIVVFASIHAYTKNMKSANCPNVLRWFDLVQNNVVKANELTEDFPVFEINLDDVAAAAAAGPAKKGEKPAPKVQEKAAPKVQEKLTGEAKPKKEKKKAEKKPAPAPVESEQPVVSRLDIRVGFIKNCKKHDGADTLYVEEIDLGEEEPRTVVSGLVKWYPIEEMQNRWVLCLANLKPANMRGVKSQAMVLCASPADGSKVELLAPVDTSKVKPGDRIYFEGEEGEAEKSLNPKKKYWETVQPQLNTKDDLLAYFGEKPFLIKTASGESIKVKAATVQGGGIR
ncbi:nucleic acid-binding protein [Backusella circina FSU 941]|nr:nucleic acid-binding protein [Backusella circina FSU 941]